MIVRGVNFQKIKEKTKKNELTVNCYRMPSTGNYVILFVSTVKLNLLNWVIILIVRWMVAFVLKTTYTNKENGSEIQGYREMREIP